MPVFSCFRQYFLSGSLIWSCSLGLLTEKLQLGIDWILLLKLICSIFKTVHFLLYLCLMSLSIHIKPNRFHKKQNIFSNQSFKYFLRNWLINQELVINMKLLPCVFLLLGDRLCLLYWETHFGVNKIPSPFPSYDAQI